jgi:hypothetical protein
MKSYSKPTLVRSVHLSSITAGVAISGDDKGGPPPIVVIPSDPTEGS